MHPSRWISKLIKVIAFVFGVISIPIAYVFFFGDIPQGYSFALVVSFRVALYALWLIAIGTILSFLASSGRGIGWLLSLPTAIPIIALRLISRSISLPELGLTLVFVCIPVVSSHFGAWLGSRLAGSGRRRWLGFALAVAALGVAVALFIRPPPW